MDTYKVWKSLTEPIMLKGITFDYLVILVGLSVTMHFFTFGGFVVPIVILLLGLVVGYVMSRKDKRWFSVVRVNTRHFGTKVFRRRRFLR